MRIFEQNLKKDDVIHLIPRLIVVIIIAQTLPFKYMGAEESVYLFRMLNMEPFGRILIAIIETTAVLLLLTRFYILGAIISLSIISAANFLHFVKLGFIVNDDGGTLFIMSIIVVVCSLWVVIYWNVGKGKKRRVEIELPKEPDSDFVDY